MSLLLNSLIVTDPTSKYHNSLVNILISSDGKISKISKKKINDKVKKIINCDNKKVTRGWMDFGANFCDPGFEFKEDLISGYDVAKEKFQILLEAFLLFSDGNPQFGTIHRNMNNIIVLILIMVLV